MKPFDRISLRLKTASQLGFRQSFNFLQYQLGLRSGFFALRTPALEINALLNEDCLKPNWFFALPEKSLLSRVAALGIPACLSEADRILEGQMPYFGGEWRPLTLAPEKDPQHWTHYERGSARANLKDIKYAWEPARFNWAVALAKAYFFSSDNKYAQAFWQNYACFRQANPVNQGLNWTSSQEVALRLIALVVCAHVFRDAPASTPENLSALSINIADHAGRIPPTICYARAQHNNHLLSEAVGLVTAALFLPAHPDSPQWRKLGLRLFNEGVRAQVADDGTYVQHSTNYHRLFLIVSLWMQVLLEKEHLIFEDAVLNRLAAAAQWLALRLDRTSGRVPNLGHNDGSNFLPFSCLDFQDYRPVVQAAARAYLARPALPPGPWDDLCLWLDLPVIPQKSELFPPEAQRSQLILTDNSQGWASLRAAAFTSRPAHADQLHVEIWHRGVNFAMDAGTFQYNAPPPWENALAATAVHNTITIDGRDQMTRAGKFLWLDWAQAQVESPALDSVAALHFGYRNLGVIHRRRLQKRRAAEWLITDELLPAGGAPREVKAVLNWLVPDWPFEIMQDHCVALRSPLGPALLTIAAPGYAGPALIDVFRCGESQLTGQQNSCLGWVSPTYGLKLPALSIQFTLNALPPIQIRTQFLLPV